MKTLLLAVVATISFGALAQPNTSTEFRIEKRLERLVELVQRDRAHRFLSEDEKRNVLQNINAAIVAIKDENNTPNPGPNPNPYPNPNPNPYPNRIVVEGKIEQTNFIFDAVTTGQIFNQCSDFVRTRFSQVDDMMISINGNAYKRLINSSSYWNGADAICNVIYAQLTPENMRLPIPQYIMIEGFIEQTRVEFVGNSYAEVFNKCVRSVETKFSQVDDMEIGVNGDRRYRSVNSSSYWRGAVEICTVVMKNVPRL